MSTGGSIPRSWVGSGEEHEGQRVNECVRILVGKICWPDGCGRFTPSSRKVGEVARFLFGGDWVGAVWTHEIDDSGRAQKSDPHITHLFLGT